MVMWGQVFYTDGNVGQVYTDGNVGQVYTDGDVGEVVYTDVTWGRFIQMWGRFTQIVMWDRLFIQM